MDEPVLRPRCRWPIWSVFLIVALALCVRIWTVSRSEVAARDSIGFIKYALRYEREPLAQVLRDAQQPPGYPVAVLIASWPIRMITGEITPHNMALAAQVAGAAFGILLVIPMVAFGAELLSWRFGVVAAALFQCLPAWVRFTSDGLSESTFLFFTVTALWLAARYFRTHSWMSIALSGLASGGAFLTRPEGLEIVVAVGAVLVGSAVVARQTWKQSSVALAALSIGFLICFGPFFAITGRVTNKPTGRFLLGEPAAEKNFFNHNGGAPILLAVWWQHDDPSLMNRTLWASQTLLTETASSSRQIGFAMSIVGLCLWRRRILNGPGGAVMMVLAGMHALLLIRMASKIGYLSERHLALIVVTGCYPATLAIMELCRRLASRRWSPASESQLVGTMIVLTFFAAMPSLAKPMHGNRAGHRAAGEWLASHAPADAALRDPFCWAQYYSGRDFHDSADNESDVQYVVTELSDNQHSRLPLIPEVKAKAAVGELVYQWPEHVAIQKARVAVYRWTRPKAATATHSLPPAAGDVLNRNAAALP